VTLHCSMLTLLLLLRVQVFGWFGPFYELTGHSVGYLVDGIAQSSTHSCDMQYAYDTAAAAAPRCLAGLGPSTS
jgi:hypothetical protein